MFTVSTLSKGRNFTKNVFVIVAENGNDFVKAIFVFVERIVRLVAFYYVVSTMLLLWTGLWSAWTTCSESLHGSETYWNAESRNRNVFFLKSLGLHQDVTRPACRFCVLQYSDGAKTAQYDIHINPVTPQDAGVYTCVDEAGLGAKASATLSVVPPSTSQPSSTTRVSSTTRYTTRLSLSSTHDEGAFCTHDL